MNSSLMNSLDMSYLNPKPTNSAKPTIAIIGGGVGGATIALKLSELGANIVLFEKEDSLVNGPPICHLHAGGNLYREISDEQCLDLLEQSINTAKVYRHAIDYRPTVFAVPKSDKGEPSDIITRLNKLQDKYTTLVAIDPENEVLGKPSEYYRLYDRNQVEEFAQLETPDSPKTPEQWMIAFSKSVDLDQLKFPLMLVQEYGVSVFRVGATAMLALEKNTGCKLLTNTQVNSVTQNENDWNVEVERHGEKQNHQVDYVINACGFRTGTIDDMVGVKPQRMVEFKAAYVCHWPGSDHKSDSKTTNSNNWPEVIFHGERGTPNGMTQLTPYPDGYFQIHGMTKDITLFEDGLVSAETNSAQPKLSDAFIKKVNHKWDQETINARTNRAIGKVTNFIPSFGNAEVASAPMYGAQQIPGNDDTLRVADVAFEQKRYARCEIVKASSALTAAEAIIENLVEEGLMSSDKIEFDQFPIIDSLIEQDITDKAEQLTIARNYPTALANRNVSGL